MRMLEFDTMQPWRWGIGDVSPLPMYVFPEFPKCFRFQMMKGEKRKA